LFIEIITIEEEIEFNILNRTSALEGAKCRLDMKNSESTFFPIINVDSKDLIDEAKKEGVKPHIKK